MNATKSLKPREKPSTANDIDPPPLSVCGLGLDQQPSVTMSLLSSVRTPVSEKAVHDLSVSIYAGHGRKQRPSVQYITALAATVADLLKGMSHDPMRPCFRRMSPIDFTDKAVGFRPFTRVLDDLERHEFAWRASGHAAFRGKAGAVSRIVPTVRLTNFMASYGITAANWRDHFHAPKAYKSHEPLALKSGRTYGLKWKKVPGKTLAVDYLNPRATRYANQMTRINAFLAAQTYSFGDEPVLFRGFNLGDDRSFDYNKGGRLNCYGGGYQHFKKAKRADIIINGSATIEIDISACHITIAHGLCGVPLPNRSDLYEIEGIARDIVKSYVTLFLGLGHSPKAWTDEHRQKFGRKDNAHLGRAYPITKVGKKVLLFLPVLREVEARGLTWADFHFTESEIVVNVIDRLIQEQGVCVLPVHDSLICALNHKSIAESYLSQVFYEFVGLKPKLKE